jgi:hypothetical protein
LIAQTEPSLDDPKPWFDLLEATLVFREATSAITGSTPKLDIRILDAQQRNRSLLGIE